jgi:NarL family two-component system response regulator LiaR
MKHPIRIVLADDHTLFREGLKTILASQKDIEIVGEAANGLEAVEMTRKLTPDLLLLDIKMPKLDGLQVIDALKKKSPPTRILVLTGFADDERLFPSIKSGALGFLLKDASGDQLLKAIRDVANDCPYLDPSIAYKMLSEFRAPALYDQLSDRETETLRLVASGLSNQEIAEQLNISEHTVGKYVSSVLLKLQLSNRTQASLYAVRHKLINLDDL